MNDFITDLPCLRLKNWSKQYNWGSSLEKLLQVKYLIMPWQLFNLLLPNGQNTLLTVILISIVDFVKTMLSDLFHHVKRAAKFTL